MLVCQALVSSCVCLLLQFNMSQHIIVTTISYAYNVKKLPIFLILQSIYKMICFFSYLLQCSRLWEKCGWNLQTWSKEWTWHLICSWLQVEEVIWIQITPITTGMSNYSLFFHIPLIATQKKKKYCCANIIIQNLVPHCIVHNWKFGIDILVVTYSNHFWILGVSVRMSSFSRLHCSSFLAKEKYAYGNIIPICLCVCL
jgi:hypothetical protein